MYDLFESDYERSPISIPKFNVASMRSTIIILHTHEEKDEEER